MAALGAGDMHGAFNSFMQGVCGDQYREVVEHSLGQAGYERAVRESAFFLRDEVPAALEWQFGPAEARSVRQPILLLEGGDGRIHGLLSQQVTESVIALLPQAEVHLIANTNHLMPLQQPNAVARTVADFAVQHPATRQV